MLTKAYFSFPSLCSTKLHFALQNFTLSCETSLRKAQFHRAPQCAPQCAPFQTHFILSFRLCALFFPLISPRAKFQSLKPSHAGEGGLRSKTDEELAAHSTILRLLILLTYTSSVTRFTRATFSRWRRLRSEFQSRHICREFHRAPQCAPQCAPF